LGGHEDGGSLEGRSREDEWFQRNERELLEAAQKERLKRQAEKEAAEKDAEKKRLKDLHFMKCPKCGHDMKTETLDGIEVDRCTFCEGVYFDAGELEGLFLTRDAAHRQGFLKRLLRI
jgi:hypothetical protein